MQKVSLTLDYLSIEKLLDLIKEPHGEACKRLLSHNRAVFEKAQGSTHNHQAWPGGYIDHVTDGMNYARHLYAFNKAFGRPLFFSLSDALLIFFLHDLEKPWRITILEDGQAVNKKGFETKEDFRKFRELKLVEYGIMLDPYQMNALTYVEGESKDYSSNRRVMNELAAFCHIVDVWSARVWYGYPRDSKDTLNGPDEWTDARRFRVI